MRKWTGRLQNPGPTSGAPEFEKLAPGTCLAKDIELARTFALGGSYFANGSRKGTSRVMTVHLDLPQGAPLIPMSPLASQLLSLSFQDASQGGVEADQYSRTLDGRRLIRQAYHQDAIAAARQMGLDAYYADLDQEKDRILVILNSGRATIVSQALENEPPPTRGPAARSPELAQAARDRQPQRAARVLALSDTNPMNPNS